MTGGSLARLVEAARKYELSVRVQQAREKSQGELVACQWSSLRFHAKRDYWSTRVHGDSLQCRESSSQHAASILLHPPTRRRLDGLSGSRLVIPRSRLALLESTRREGRRSSGLALFTGSSQMRV